MKYFNRLAILGSLTAVQGCAIAALTDGTAQFGQERTSMWNVQSSVNDGDVTSFDPSSRTNGTAEFAGHFMLFDNSSDQEVLFGDAALTYDFAASSDQLGGSLSDIMLVDENGARIYGFDAPKILERFSGQMSVSGDFDGNSIPLTASGTLTDGDGVSHTADMAGDLRMYQSSGGDLVLSADWANGSLTPEGGATRDFTTGYLGVTE